MKTILQHLADHADGHPNDVLATALQLGNDAKPYGTTRRTAAAVLYVAYLTEGKRDETSVAAIANEFGSSPATVRKHKNRLVADLELDQA